MIASRDDPPAITALLGQLAAVTTLIAGNLKMAGRLTFQLQGHGLVSLLLVDCDEQLHLRGTARLSGSAESVSPASTFRDLLGDGQLVLTLDTNRGDPYQSVVPLEGDSLTAVFEHYLAQSEQQPARLVLAADENFAGGLFLQKLPDADHRDADGWNRIGILADTLQPAELSDPVANLLMRVFPEENIRLFDPRPVKYHCPRDEEKILRMLRSLGRTEIEAALTEQGELMVEDDICRHSYRYGDEIVPRLFD